MLEVIMPDIKRHWRKRDWLQIEGGWTANVWEVNGEARAITTYMAYFLQDGITMKEAERKANECIQNGYTTAFVEDLKRSIFGYAVKYATMFPELRVVEESFLTGNKLLRLRGYKPEIMQTAYVPGQHPGCHGLPFVREMLRAMGREARDVAH